LNSILNVQNLSFQWGKRKVLNDVQFEVHANEFVAILGKNGAGKSTLLKCINKILKPSKGDIVLSGKSVESMDIIEISKQISYVPQAISSQFSMNVFDVVMLGRRPHISWSVGEKDLEKVSETLEFLSLEDFAFRKFDQLSGGERQRVIIAKAIAQDASLLLFDEPTSDLDLKNQIQTMKKITTLVSSQNGVQASALVAIHDINMAARFADRILLLHEGSILQQGNPAQVLTEANIAKVFGVSCEIEAKTKTTPLRIIIKDEMEGEEQ
jgi:iron complex transport system ATP-binding protein|tara:strand:- start:563 stop:1366 length:804 start_codon:yes stop_codon:yes gene_type:complete